MGKEKKDISEEIDKIQSEFERLKETREDLLRDLNQNPKLKKFINKASRVSLYAKTLLDPRHWPALCHHSTRRMLFNSKYRQGLLTGSLLRHHELYIPDGDVLTKEDAPPGRYIGYDFLRTKGLGIEQKLYKGRLMTIPNPEIAQNNPDKQTPTGAFDLFDFSHMLCIEFPSLEEALESGLLLETTVGNAYRMHKLYEQYARQIEFFGLNDEEAYMVSPKGNCLVYLAQDFGPKKPEKQGVFELKPALLPLGLRS